jgi:hypothetical protein
MTLIKSNHHSPGSQKRRAITFPTVILSLCFNGFISWNSYGAQIALCGKAVSYDSNAAQGSTQQQRDFIGVWSGGIWNSNVCGALIVESVGYDGSATVTYVYGPAGARTKVAWKALRRTALVRSGELKFDDDQGGHFTFWPAGGSLQGRFVDAKGRSLQTVLTRERDVISPVPDYPIVSGPNPSSVSPRESPPATPSTDSGSGVFVNPAR